jgi:uncharacterized protein YjiK
MIYWDRAAYWKKVTRRIVWLLGAAFAAVFAAAQVQSGSGDALGEIATLKLVAAQRVGISEVSGVDARIAADGAVRVLAVGDHDAELADATAASLESRSLEVGAVRSFAPAVLAGFSPCAGAPGKTCRSLEQHVSSQWEALRVDGAGQVLALQEYSRAVFVLSPDLASVRAVVNFSLGDDAERWRRGKKGDNAGAEGIVLLRGGHLLVARERAPATLVEVGPEGESALGVSAATLLPPEAEFQLPASSEATLSGARRVKFVPLASWTIDGSNRCDNSEVAASDGRLYVLSEKCRLVRVLAALEPLGGAATVMQTWRLPQGITTPEGLAVLPDGKMVIGSDRRGLAPNLFLVEP